MTIGEADVLDQLMDEHRQVQSLIEQLKVEDDPEVARDMADVLIASLVRHSVAEEMYVYPVMKEFLPDGEEAVQHDIAEHDQIERLLKDLEGAEVADMQFLDLISELEAVVVDHVADEEHDQFPKLRMTVPAQRLVDLRATVRRAEDMAPTRAHPSAPHSELFHKVVGPGVGMVDRLRDALTGRMTS